MVIDIILIAIVGAIAGLASIPFGFTLTSSVYVVFIGNAFGSLVAALALLYFSDKLIARFFKKGVSDKSINRITKLLNKYGLRIFGLVSPLFPGVTVSVPSAILLKVDMKTYKRWMYVGIFLISGAYVVAYWAAFVR
jgi:hypothetical protein